MRRVRRIRRRQLDPPRCWLRGAGEIAVPARASRSLYRATPSQLCTPGDGFVEPRLNCHDRCGVADAPIAPAILTMRTEAQHRSIAGVAGSELAKPKRVETFRVRPAGPSAPRCGGIGVVADGTVVKWALAGGTCIIAVLSKSLLA
eukprot:3413698-Alexandrium_andersonii.AAC.1